MKIGINARFLIHPYTGIGQYTYNIIQALAENDVKNEYFLYTPELVEITLPENFHQVRIPEKPYKSASLRKAHWEHILVPQEMKNCGVNLAHFLYPSNPNKSLGVPVVVTVHDVIPWALPEYNSRLRSKVYNFYSKLALKKADHIITVSQFSKDEIMRTLKIEEKNIHVVHLAPPIIRNEENLPDTPLRRNYLLYVGGYDGRKNVPQMMIAFQKHIANYYPIDLIMVGAKDQGLERYLTNSFCERVADKIPVKPKGNIIFTENMHPGELDYLYKQATALVHFSKYEGFNLPLVEAMSHDIPVICSDIPVNHEVTAGAAHFVDPSDENTIGLGIHEFLNNKALQKELKIKSHERAKDFNWKKTAEETLYVYTLFH